MADPEHLTLDDLLVPTTLRLTTVAGLQRLLLRLGLDWDPTPMPRVSSQPGLYCWVDGSGPHDLEAAGVLYVGVGRGAGGTAERLRRETSWVARGVHGHGRAVRRLAGRALGGPVHRVPVDLSWLPEVIPDDAAARTERWLRGGRDAPHVAEAVAIRLSLHVGDVAAPVNATTAWDTDSPADWAAWALVQHLGLDDTAGPAEEPAEAPVGESA